MTSGPIITNGNTEITDMAVKQLFDRMEPWLRLKFQRLPRGEEAARGSGDYVFIQEILVTNDSDPVEFTNIPQAFRHLELRGECANAIDNGSPDDLCIQWNGQLTAFSWAAQAMTHDGGQTGDSNQDDACIRIAQMVPSRTFDSPGSENVRMLLRLLLPYYSRSDFIKGLTWDATTVQSDSNPASCVGGGQLFYNSPFVDGASDPVTSLLLQTDNEREHGGAGFAAGSAFSMYGIR